MGLPIWREPAEKRETDTILDPRRAAISRRSRPLDSRPRIRASDRSSETLFNLLRSDYALESMNVGGAASTFSTERRGTYSNWEGITLPTTAPDPERERAALRVTLSESEPRTSRGGLRRMRSPVPGFRSEVSQDSSVSASSETYTPRFPPTFPEARAAIARSREIEMELGRRMERERERVRERQEFDERRRPRQTFTAAVAEATAARRPGDESGGPRFRFPAQISRYLSGVADENDSSRLTEYITRPMHLPRFDIDGLGDRERSLSPDDATQWELVANDLGFQAACDLWESGDSEDGGGEGGELDLWNDSDRRDEMFSPLLFFARNRDNREAERLVERL